jgi:hypothetical protein
MEGRPDPAATAPSWTPPAPLLPFKSATAIWRLLRALVYCTVQLQLLKQARLVHP